MSNAKAVKNVLDKGVVFVLETQTERQQMFAPLVTWSNAPSTVRRKPYALLA